MKKHYSLVLILFSILSFAQQIISFEDAEGFSPIDVNGQMNWISTPTGGNPANVTHQVVSTDNASDGIRSLKIVKESTYGTQTDPIIGGFYNLQNPLSSANFSLSFEINMSQHNGSVFGFQAVDNTEEQFAVRMDFDKTGVVKILDMTSGTQTLVPLSEIWVPNTWYKCKVVGTAADIKYYINNALIYTGSASAVDISQLRFVHNNALGTAYIDNIVITNGAVMAVKDVKSNTKFLSLYPNPASDFIKINSQNKIKNVKVYDLNGKKIDVKLNGDEIDLRTLSAGEYLLTAEADGKSSTEKFIKK